MQDIVSQEMTPSFDDFLQISYMYLSSLLASHLIRGITMEHA
jgi:hypothetical protein